MDERQAVATHAGRFLAFGGTPRVVMDQDELDRRASRAMVANAFLDALKVFMERMDQIDARGEQIESAADVHAVAAERIALVESLSTLFPFPDAEVDSHLTAGVDLLIRSATIQLNSKSFLGLGRPSEARKATALLESGWDEMKLGFRRVRVIAETGDGWDNP